VRNCKVKINDRNKIIDRLFEMGLKYEDLKNNKGETPLNMAVNIKCTIDEDISEIVELIEFFLKHGASLMETSSECGNLFFKTVKNGIYSLEFFRGFMNSGGDLWQCDQNGRFILHDLISISYTGGGVKTSLKKQNSDTNKKTLKAIKEQIIMPMILEDVDKLFKRICYREMFDVSVSEDSQVELCGMILQIIKQKPEIDTRDSEGNNLLHYCVCKYRKYSDVFDMKGPKSLFLGILEVTNDKMKKRLFNEKNGMGKTPYLVFLERILDNLDHNPKELMESIIEVSKSFMRYVDKEKLCLDEVNGYVLYFMNGLDAAQYALKEEERQVLYSKYVTVVNELRNKMLEPMVKKKGMWGKLNNFTIYHILEFVGPVYVVGAKSD